MQNGGPPVALNNVHILSPRSWVCPVCGDRPPADPNNPSMPQGVVTIIAGEPLPTVHCGRCWVTLLRKTLPALERVGDTPPTLTLES